MQELKIFRKSGLWTSSHRHRGQQNIFLWVWRCKGFGYANHKAINMQKDGVVIHLTDTLGRRQSAKFINEGNLYRLISQLPSAEKFEKWVGFDEVLPSIRQTGNI